MKKITIVYSYFNQKEWLEKLLKYWNNYYKNYIDLLDIIIIDDYSTIPAYPVVKANYKFNNIKVVNITQDLGFGSIAARNLGAVLATTDNVLLLDIDNVITPYLLQEMLDWNYKEDTFYYRFFNSAYKLSLRFNLQFRKSSHTLYINKNLFFSIGGYPKDLIGGYGYEDHLIFDFLEIKLTNKYTSRKYPGNKVIDLKTVTHPLNKFKNNFASDMRVFDIYDDEYISRGFKIINKNPVFLFNNGKSNIKRDSKRNYDIYIKLLQEKLIDPVFTTDIFLPEYELAS